MSVYVRILHESPLKLWGLTSRERLERMLTKAGVACNHRDDAAVAGEDTVLLLRGDFLYDQRIVKNMVDSIGVVLEINLPEGVRPVAAHVPAELADRMESILCAGDQDGYPEGLRGEAIPVSGRLMAIADVYDALISKRVYKPALSHQEACEIIKADRGSHFDPVLVDAFVEVSPEFAQIAERFAGTEPEEGVIV